MCVVSVLHEAFIPAVHVSIVFKCCIYNFSDNLCHTRWRDGEHAAGGVAGRCVDRVVAAAPRRTRWGGVCTWLEISARHMNISNLGTSSGEPKCNDGCVTG